jgi:hypothetical protein
VHYRRIQDFLAPIIVHMNVALFIVVIALFQSTVYGGDHLILKALVRHDRLEDVLKLVDTGIDPNDSDPERGWTPLIYAAYTGQTDLAEFLLLAGAKVDLTCIDGWSPLMFAARHGHAETARKLLSHGANPFLMSNNAMSALIAAEQSRNDDVVDVVKEYIRHYSWQNMFVKDDGSESNILMAAHDGDTEMLSALMQEGHDPNERSIAGWTPIVLGKPSINI